MRKKETYTVSMEPGHVKKLNEIAKKFDCFWGDNPSASALIRAICDEEIVLFRAGSIEALNAEKTSKLRTDLLEAQAKLSEVALEINNYIEKI